MRNLESPLLVCQKCDHRWKPYNVVHVKGKPRTCPKCGSVAWDGDRSYLRGKGLHLGVRKEELRKTLVALRKANPCATQQVLGSKLGLSKQRVSQLLQSEKSPTKAWHQEMKCNNCGEVYNLAKGDSGKALLYCRDCRAKKEIGKFVVECSYCGKTLLRKLSELIGSGKRNPVSHSFCNKDCRSLYYKATVF